MSQAIDHLHAVQQRIREAELRFERRLESVSLLAVSKTKPVTAIGELADAGQSAFGENYLQEALQKMDELAARHLDWHFIGPIQSNKTHPLAERFDWVHTVDRFKIARRLSEQRPPELPPLNICLQVNISGEVSKSGVLANELGLLAQQVSELPHLKLRGLMAIPAPSDDFAEQRSAFAKLRELQQGLKNSGLALDTLSMGMSADIEAAIAEGATIVRVGTALFGAREPKPS